MNKIAVFMLLSLAMLRPVSANTIGLGIDWREKVYIQEYWQGGVPFYAISNLRPETVKITVTRYSGAKGNATKEALAGPWEVKPNSVLQVEARNLMGKGMLEFSSGTITL